MKTKISFILFLVCSTFYGQTQQEGEIVISKAHLISILQKFKKQDSSTLDKQAVTSQVLLALKTVANDSVMQRMRVLENELESLRSKIDTVSKRAVVRDTVYLSTLKTVVTRDTVYNANSAYQKPTVVSEDSRNYERQLSDLNSKYDAILRNQERLLTLQTVNTVAVPAAVAVVAQPKAQPKEVVTVAPVESLVVLTDTPAAPTTSIVITPEITTVTAAQLLKEKFAKIQARVYFDNNSAKISGTDALRLHQLLDDLTLNPSLQVFLDGYASKSGNVAYNTKLSMLRNDAVKQYLIQEGVPANRISSEYHGVDATSLDAAAARRVEVSFDVRD
ncbi:OmpA family protein [Flavobacterium faecale]|nr:OmpA family protein [Flavobacterium faecale]